MENQVPSTLEGFEPEPRSKAISLRLVLEKSLTKAELAEYNELSAEGALERARGVKTLHLEWQNIGEIANLEPFEATEVLYIQYNRIERIEGLECMPRLQFLALQHNRITKVENLKFLRELEFLDLSKNQITTLNERELPESLNILNLMENPCTGAPDYRNRLLAHLSNLVHLDGEELQAGLGATASAGSLSAATAEAASDLLLTEQGLSAYWRKGELQTAGEAMIADKIQAYSIEALADVDGFGKQVEDASERSKVRRSKMEKSSRMGSSLREEQLAALIKEKEQLAARLKENARAAAEEEAKNSVGAVD